MTPPTPAPPLRAPAGADADPEGNARFRRTLAKVMSMQLFALLVLWWLQARYNS